MKDHDGLPESAVWLLADSNPVQFEDDLDCPLDRRFPTRHNIWTPIVDVIQRRLWERERRLDDTKLYVRNAVENPDHKRTPYKEQRDSKIEELRVLLNEHHPLFVLCFGQFAFEFARQARREKPEHPFDGKGLVRYWTVKRLAEQFSERIAPVRLDPDVVNVLPLLHAVVAQDFRHCHEYFSGKDKKCSGDDKRNYFEYVGQMIAEVLIHHRDHPRLRGLWM